MDAKRVLVIEDGSAIRNGLVDALKLTGYEVLQAANGTDGLSLTKKAMFNLLLLDFVLSNMNRLDTLT